MIEHNAQAKRTDAKKLISLNGWGRGGLGTLSLILGKGFDFSFWIGIVEC